ncbi:hypothetical protein PF011_g28702 [Phytophthora fragariae]|uniref:Uncharacterized protein n=1 Tax=Phytophthora fragariae TaxID=53985 RepID=A0A6A3H5I8_9STRA|nr:hypothetical protein PF011_g28702 [Phytophthora fragariae]
MEDSEEERSDIEEEAVDEQSEDVGSGTAAGHGLEPRSRGVFEELWEEEEADELKEDEDGEEEEEDAGVKTEPETEVKTEHGEETEPYEESGYYETEEVYETEPSREERSPYGSSAYSGYGGVYYTGPGYGQYGDCGGYSQPLEYEGYGEADEEGRTTYLQLETLGAQGAATAGNEAARTPSGMARTVWREACTQTNGCSVRPEPDCSIARLAEASDGEE